MRAKFNEWWEKQEPSGKRNTILLVCISIFVLVALAMPEREKKELAGRKPDKIAGAFLDSSTEDADITRVNAKIDVEAQERERLREQVSSLVRKVDELSDQNKGAKSLNSYKGNSEGKNVEEQMLTLKKEMNDLRRMAAENNSRTPGNSVSGEVFSGNESASTFAFDPLTNEKTALSDAKPKADAVKEKRPSEDNAYKTPESKVEDERKPRKIRIFDPNDPNSAGIIGGSEEEDEDGGKEGKPSNSKVKKNETVRNKVMREFEDDYEKIFLPPGSIMSAFLINGVYLPTSSLSGNSTGKNPHPIQMRVAGDAKLPNGGTENLKDCMVFGSGWAELSTSRAHFRTVNITCQRNGTYFTGELQAYVSGEDGIEGMSGPVVEKTGAALMRAWLAGMGAGFASAAKPVPVNSIQTGDDAGEISFERPNMGESAEYGMYEGMSKSMDEISQYYLDRAKDIVPVVEISALREIVIHVQQPLMLEPINIVADTKKKKR